jgi:hypothetical protein
LNEKVEVGADTEEAGCWLKENNEGFEAAG